MRYPKEEKPQLRPLRLQMPRRNSPRN